MSVNHCALITDLIALLSKQQGHATYHEIGRKLFYLTSQESSLARQVLLSLLEHDNRFAFHDSGLELLPDPRESRRLEDSTFVVVDVETTGALLPRDRVIELAAFKISRGKIIGEFSTLVNPQRSIPPFITQLTGISDKMVTDAPIFTEVCRQVLDFFHDAVFVAHNAPFDWRFLQSEVERSSGESLTNPRVCTVQMARRLVPGLENYQLHTVADHYRINIPDRHRAKGDAWATTKIFIHFLEMLIESGVPDLSQARRFRIRAN